MRALRAGGTRLASPNPRAQPEAGGRRRLGRGGREGGAASGRGPAPAAGAAHPGRPSAPHPCRARLPTSRLRGCAASRSARPARRRAMGPERCLALGGLLALAGLLEGRLVRREEAGFGECDRFFYAGTPPAGPAAAAHVRICQRSEGAERFATLYSTQHRIPVYSAFRAARPAPLGAEPRWLVEPQVSQALPEPGGRTGFAGRLAAPASGREGNGDPGLRCRGPETRVSDLPRRAPGITACLVPCRPRGPELGHLRA